MPTNKKPQRVHKVTSIKPDAAIWAAALELAGGDKRRLVTISKSEVLITRPAPRKVKPR